MHGHMYVTMHGHMNGKLEKNIIPNINYTYISCIYMIMVHKHEGNKPLWITKRRWDNNIKMDFK
jgi:hypothetical protein